MNPKNLILELGNDGISNIQSILLAILNALNNIQTANQNQQEDDKKLISVERAGEIINFQRWKIMDLLHDESNHIKWYKIGHKTNSSVRIDRKSFYDFIESNAFTTKKESEKTEEEKND